MSVRIYPALASFKPQLQTAARAVFWMDATRVARACIMTGRHTANDEHIEFGAAGLADSGEKRQKNKRAS